MGSVLITGGTGSMGQALVRRLLAERNQVDVSTYVVSPGTKTHDAGPRYDRIIVYSRDEWKQSEMRAAFPDERLRFFIGDVRDRQRLTRAMRNVSRVIHAAALKQVPSCEYNPLEAVKTNVDGTANVIDAALDAQVARVLMLSSDKACDPTNLYGATKLVAEKLIVDANVYGGETTKFACTRYGNVLGSRGSVLPLFQAQAGPGRSLTVTDPDMTRFVLTLEQGVKFVLESLELMQGGEVFVPKLPAVTVRTIAEAATWPAAPRMVISGLRPGEKRHEVLVSAHEAARTRDEGEYFVVGMDARPGPGAEFRFASDTAERLGVQRFRHLAGLTGKVAPNEKERPRAATAPGA